MTSNRTTGFAIAIGILTASLGGTTYWFLFKGALNQGEDDLQAHLAILKLESSRAAAVQLGGSSNRLLVRNKPSSLERYLAREGWQKTDQMGATVIFERNEQQKLYASCGLYSPLYNLCSLSL